MLYEEVHGMTIPIGSEVPHVVQALLAGICKTLKTQKAYGILRADLWLASELYGL